MYIIFNTKYTLKPDEGRALIMSKYVGRGDMDYVDETFTSIVHPLYAKILCFFDGSEYDDCVKNAADYLQTSTENVKKFADKLIDNGNFVEVNTKSGTSVFPPFTLTKRHYYKQEKYYSPEKYDYTSIDLRVKRHSTPSEITLMVNNVCVTNCMYCFEDKSKVHNCQIPLSRIKELILEAKQLNVRTFDVIGGEFFLYKYWKEVLAELHKHGFHPYLSTKMPLNVDFVKNLAEMKIKDIQISLDSLDACHLSGLLSVKPDYCDKMKQALHWLNKYDILVSIHTVLAKINGSIADMKSIFDYIKGMHNIIEWKIVKADYTIYAKDYLSKIQISDEKLLEINGYIETIKSGSPFKVEFDLPIEQKTDKETRKAEFSKRAFCSGLYSSLYILPTGDVTICEQTYWHPHFIVGNVLNQGLQEIWTSEKAKSIYYIKQEEIPDDSLCHHCKDFSECRSLKQVCYRDIIKEYGLDKWYYPDPNCPKLSV